MIILSFSFAIGFVFNALLLGVFVQAIDLRFKLPSRSIRLLLLAALCIVEDVYYWPALSVLNLSCTIGHVDVAEFLGVAPNTNILKYTNVGFSDIILLGLKVFVADFMTRKIFQTNNQINAV
jgi:hypothetical protein